MSSEVTTIIDVDIEVGACSERQDALAAFPNHAVSKP
jgi:hypothetical protein